MLAQNWLTCVAKQQTQMPRCSAGLFHGGHARASSDLKKSGCKLDQLQSGITASGDLAETESQKQFHRHRENTQQLIKQADDINRHASESSDGR